MPKITFKPFALACTAAVLTIFVGVRLAMALTGVDPANQPVGYVAQDELTNFDLRSGQEILFRNEYHREYWDGDLIAYKLNSSGDISAATQPWVAAAGGNAGFQLDTRKAARIIVTKNSAGSNIAFTWADLDATQKGQISSSEATSAASNVLNFLRGDRSKEIQQGGTFRQRASPLGDIIHSRPFYVKDGAASTVFVGANDGMLHAFNASTGAERWAYVPSMLIPKLSKLAVNPYVHDYYVDASVNVATIGSGAQRVLVGGLGAGGKGLYALDITGASRLTPVDETAAKTNILWEITPSSAGYGNLGYTYSTPVIAQLNVGGVQKDVVIIGNGYNNSGDGKAYLLLINAADGSLIQAIPAVATGSTASASNPNGLSSPVAVDDDGDGSIDAVYAGDLDGSMWKFNLLPLKTSGTPTATALLTTSPAQPITMTPGVARHPVGGYMVNFATGAMLRSTDATDKSDNYVYGIWDSPPAGNNVLLSQTITERCYTVGTAAVPTPCTNRVRTVTSNVPNWTAGTGHHIGWKVLLPRTSAGVGGERVVGDGSFIENGRFYFSSYNPNVASTVQGSTVKGENWLMELDYLTGGAKNSPFLDLSADLIVSNDDRVKDGASPAAPVLTTDGIPVGRAIATGVMSQPILVQLNTLNDTLFNVNPDVSVVPVVLGTGTGVTGGHFDVDFFHTKPTGGTQSSFTLTVGTTGQISGVRANMGAITVDGVTIVPALTILDISNGTAASTNATTIKNAVTNGFTASVSGTTVTIKAPMGSKYNGKAVVIAAGTEQLPAAAAVPAVQAVTGAAAVAPTPGSFSVQDVGSNKTVSLKCGSSYFGQSGTWKTLSNSSSLTARLNDLYDKINQTTVNGYTTTCPKVGNTTALNCTVVAPAGLSACSGGFSIDSDISASNNVGPQGGSNAVIEVIGSPAVPTTGWTNFAPALSATAFNNNGSDPVTPGDTCTTTDCVYDRHIHQYDDVYDVTGVNMLNPSDANVHINLGLASMMTNFKILVHNQYLSPAVKLNIGNPNYRFDVDYGYVAVKNYQTGSTLDLATVQTYRRDPFAVWPGTAVTNAEKAAMPKPIGSLVFNMPLDALDVEDWWGNGDKRVGLMPMQPQCMWQAEGPYDGNMYKPVIPPALDPKSDLIATKGWGAATTPATATGARHGGALTVQLIRDTTPNSAIELNVAGRPEFGWRVKSDQFSTYVIAEWGTYWHHPNGKCMYDKGWTKTPPQDNGSSKQSTKAVGATDPHLGDLSAGGGNGSATVSSVTTTVTGNVTTTVISYVGGTSATIVRTLDPTTNKVTIVTTDATGNVTTQTIDNASGSLAGGGNERGVQAGTGRISWREVVSP